MDLPSSPIESIFLDTLSQFNVSIDVKRDDLIHPVISGNKRYKLHFYIQDMLASNKTRLVTFGGAYSNHLHATACVGNELGIQTVGIVRAEPHELNNPTPTLKDCQQWGMTLEPVSRAEYRLKQASPVVAQICAKYPDAYWVPEGGSGELGVKGAEYILSGVQQSNYDVIVLACGTGTTLAGVVRASVDSVNVIGIPVLKGAKWMQSEVAQYLPATKRNWQLNYDYHFSGYGKWNDELVRFSESITQQSGIPLDLVYTAKAFYALVDLISAGKIARNSRVLFIHTGGLQGSRS